MSAKVKLLFSGGLKPGLRQLRNSSKLNFQSAFSSESSIRASTHRFLMKANVKKKYTHECLNSESHISVNKYMQLCDKDKKRKR